MGKVVQQELQSLHWAAISFTISPAGFPNYTYEIDLAKNIAVIDKMKTAIDTKSLNIVPHTFLPKLWLLNMGKQLQIQYPSYFPTPKKAI